jgi:hypothetical protein
MSIAWSTIDAAIKAAVSACAGNVQARWKWEQSKLLGKVTIKLKRSPVRSFGRDLRRRAYDADDDVLNAEQVGQRAFQLEVRCESDRGSPSDTAPVAAADVLAQVMTRIYRPAILAALRTAGTTVVQVGNITRTEYKIEGREYEAAIVEMTMHCTDVDADGDDYWIESVNGTLTGETSDTIDRTVPIVVA